MFPGSVILSPLGSGSSKSDFISLTFLAGLCFGQQQQEHRSARMSDVVHITVTAYTIRDENSEARPRIKLKHNPGIVMIMLRAVKP